MKPIPKEQLDSLQSRLESNASDLLTEATLLHANGHYARAFALAHLASEELAKVPQVNAVCVALERGASVDWREFDRRFRDHRAKIKMFAKLRYFADSKSSSGSHVDDLSQRLERVDRANQQKNAALYVGYSDGIALSPSDVVAEQDARLAIGTVGEALSFLADARKQVNNPSSEYTTRLWGRVEALLAAKGIKR